MKLEIGISLIKWESIKPGCDMGAEPGCYDFRLSVAKFGVNYIPAKLP